MSIKDFFPIGAMFALPVGIGLYVGVFVASYQACEKFFNWIRNIPR